MVSIAKATAVRCPRCQHKLAEDMHGEASCVSGADTARRCRCLTDAKVDDTFHLTINVMCASRLCAPAARSLTSAAFFMPRRGRYGHRERNGRIGCR